MAAKKTAKPKKPAKTGKKTEKGEKGLARKRAAARELLFAYAYIANGGNGYQAAIDAGFKPGAGAEKAATRMSGNVRVQEIITKATKAAAEKAGLSVERTLQEVARLAYSDPRKLYDADGNLIPIHQLDDDVAATVASVKIVEMAGGMEVDGKKNIKHVAMHTKEIKHWDKNSALEKAMKYHGLYETDNKQKGEAASLALKVVFGK